MSILLEEEKKQHIPENSSQAETGTPIASAEQNAVVGTQLERDQQGPPPQTPDQTLGEIASLPPSSQMELSRDQLGAIVAEHNEKIQPLIAKLQTDPSFNRFLRNSDEGKRVLELRSRRNETNVSKQERDEREKDYELALADAVSAFSSSSDVSPEARPILDNINLTGSELIAKRNLNKQGLSDKEERYLTDRKPSILENIKKSEKYKGSIAFFLSDLFQGHSDARDLWAASQMPREFKIAALTFLFGPGILALIGPIVVYSVIWSQEEKRQKWVTDEKAKKQATKEEERSKQQAASPEETQNPSPDVLVAPVGNIDASNIALLEEEDENSTGSNVSDQNTSSGS